MSTCERLKVLTFQVAAALLLVSIASANPVGDVWFDDMESGTNGWWSMDLSIANVSPHFHTDTYMAYEGSWSWWCGNYDYDTDGGYGNEWDDRLELPPIELGNVAIERVTWGEVKSKFRDSGVSSDGRQTSDTIIPVLTFAFRHDSEPDYDITYVQAESNGVYMNLNGGYDGVLGWTDLGAAGFALTGYDDPLRIRFRFVSDAVASDEDGGYGSVGGAFAVDNIKVYDLTTGDVFFYDDVESGGLCSADIPPAAGDYWHIVDRPCPAYSDPHSWWCGVDADTGLIPPNLKNALFSPVIDVSPAYSCTAFFAIHMAVPTVDNDYVAFLGSVNGGQYYQIASYWGDFGTCDGWATLPLLQGYCLDQFGTPVSQAGMAFVMHTTDDGCGPGGAGDAGVMLDDFRIETNGGRGVSQRWKAAVRPEVAGMLYEMSTYGRVR